MNEAIENSNICVVHFFADECRPCKIQKMEMERTLDFICEHLHLQFTNKEVLINKTENCFVGCDFYENPEIAEQYEVEKIPTLLLFKKGKLELKTRNYTDIADRIIDEQPPNLSLEF